jgi:hypothetical protein
MQQLSKQSKVHETRGIEKEKYDDLQSKSIVLFGLLKQADSSEFRIEITRRKNELIRLDSMK